MLEDAGYKVKRRPEGADPATAATMETAGNLRDAAHTVVVLSAAYVASKECQVVRGEVAVLDPIGSRRLVVLIGVGGPAYTNPFENRPRADLDQLDERAARAAVFRVIERGTVIAPPSDATKPVGARFPGTEPPVWNVGSRNPNFTGRTRILEELRKELRRGGAATLLQVLHGLGGVGKTQIAMEYAAPVQVRLRRRVVDPEPGARSGSRSPGRDGRAAGDQGQ